MLIFFELMAVALFALSSGLFFHRRFRHNWRAVGVAGLIALASSYFVLEEVSKRLFLPHASSKLEGIPAAPAKSMRAPKEREFGVRLFSGIPGRIELVSNLSNLQTVNGSIAVRRLDASGSGLFWRDKKLIQDANVWLAGVYPENSPPEFVVALSNCGGSRRITYPYVIDMKADVPFAVFVPVNSEKLVVWRKNDDQYILTGPSVDDDEKDALGDSKEITVSYYRSRKFAIRSSFDEKVHYAAFVGVHPETLLGDVLAREPLLKVLGDDFAEFRRSVRTASSIELKYQRYLVGQGLGWGTGIFVIDVATGNAWAYWANPTLHHARGMPPLADDMAIKNVLFDWVKGNR